MVEDPAVLGQSADYRLAPRVCFGDAPLLWHFEKDEQSFFSAVVPDPSIARIRPVDNDSARQSK
jgi:hypothetical protein